jgi:hypothetical protein
VDRHGAARLAMTREKSGACDDEAKAARAMANE